MDLRCELVTLPLIKTMDLRTNCEFCKYANFC